MAPSPVARLQGRTPGNSSRLNRLSFYPKIPAPEWVFDQIFGISIEYKSPQSFPQNLGQKENLLKNGLFCKAIALQKCSILVKMKHHMKISGIGN